MLVHGSEPFSEIPNAAARLITKINEKYNGWFVPDVSLPVQKQLLSNFEITNISHGYLSGSYKIVTRDLHDKLRCIVEAAKRLHLADNEFVDRFPNHSGNRIIVFRKT